MKSERDYEVHVLTPTEFQHNMLDEVHCNVLNEVHDNPMEV
jgi:hypothetical protein